MNEISELLKAIAALLWPIFAFVTLFVFKDQIAEVIGRLRKEKLLGQELELSDSLESLQASASKLSEEVSSIPKNDTVDTAKDDETNIKSIIHEAARSPKAALILLATDIEQEARQLLASTGRLKERKNISVHQAIEELNNYYGLPRHVPSSLRLFWETRNKLIHGGEADERSILSAIDSGLSILKSLYAVPRETNWVYHIGVRVFSDPECKVQIANCKGIILKSESPGGTQRSYRIFPTTKEHFQLGKKVAWEWSFENTWSDAWYRDPETNEVKLAWNSSAEFVGRHLDEV
ncbi:hypothetical protein HQK29_20040 [Vibrio vulnificus]|uniref:hypothetical protein n=1 Tax=Vibrio vulnificus TaxID=672 RepID=UPI001A1E15D5|nr:hypothetical protein [Vibrio vulnificus]ELY5145894.1 hypothetical protein [Vibrio vulnificus]MCA0781332.1 hypothetical protein [Vibrio vulnificus]MCU8317655.1 hypothetical protein [Vibrio vulnificus]NTJ39839.1 hypothetical protein [Vibrio vulnificus]HAS6222028.1 hypothetical protein [Vibrio vulnificus]